MRVIRWRRWLLVGATIVIALVLAGNFMVYRAVTEFYSPGWHSRSSAEARVRGVFVQDATIRPASVQVAESVDLRVIDAWVERPTRVTFRWLVWRTENQDSTYRLVARAVHTPRDATGDWTPRTGLCFASDDVRLGGESVTTESSASAQTFQRHSANPFPGVVSLTVVRRGPGGTLPGVPPIENRCDEGSSTSMSERVTP